MAPRVLNYSWGALATLLAAGLGASVYVGANYARPTSDVPAILWSIQSTVALVAAGYGMWETRKNLEAIMRGDEDAVSVIYTRAHYRQDVFTVLGFAVWGILGIFALIGTGTDWYPKVATASLLWVQFIFAANFVLNVTLRRRMRAARTDRALDSQEG